MVLASPGGGAVEAVVLASIIVPLAVLGVVCWIFWKAAKRDRAAATSALGRRPSVPTDDDPPLDAR
jgi:uncharacterized paraquat-inducible protein A